MQEPKPTAAIIISSDRASAKAYADQSGPIAYQWLSNNGFTCKMPVIVPDEAPELLTALSSAFDQKTALVVLSGGTGIGPRDITIQTVTAFSDYEIPGIGELLRRESSQYSASAYLSRCGAWVKKQTMILALPGNPKAVLEQLSILENLIPRALSALADRCKHERLEMRSQPHAAKEENF